MQQYPTVPDPQQAPLQQPAPDSQQAAAPFAGPATLRGTLCATTSRGCAKCARCAAVQPQQAADWRRHRLWRSAAIVYVRGSSRHCRCARLDSCRLKRSGDGNIDDPDGSSCRDADTYRDCESQCGCSRVCIRRHARWHDVGQRSQHSE